MAHPAWLVVARRELLERVRTKWFVIVTLLGPVLMVGLIVLPAWLSARSAAKGVTIELVDHSDGDLGRAIGAALTATDPRLRVQPVAADTPQETLLGHIRDQAIDGFLVLPENLLDGGEVYYYGANATNFQVMATIQVAVQHAVIAVRAERAGLSATQLLSVLQPVPFEAKHTTGTTTGASGTASFLVGYIVMFVLYMAIVLYAVNVMRSVVMEKSSRVIEVMVSSVKPRAMLMGKVLGVGSVGLLQLGVWLGMAAVLANYRAQVLGFFGVHGGGFEMPAVGGVDIAVVLAYFFLGYFFYAALYAAIGAMVNSEQEAQQAQTPVILLLVIPVACVNLVANDPRGSAATVLTMIPFSSPVLMPMRWLLGGASWPDLAASLGLLAASMAVVVWLAARIYRIGILMYGKRPGLRELARWLRY